MTGLPSSIEASLRDAGFSVTEMLILRKLMEEDPLTLRQLAAKTGKSTGVLDRATKRLLNKGILVRKRVNGTPRITVASLSAIAECVEKNVREKQRTLQRRHRDVEAFLESMERTRSRPDIEYFEGSEGLRRAYTELLSREGELLHYLPPGGAAAAEGFSCHRTRRKRNVYARVIAPDTPEGRRIKERDSLEFRETKLIEEERFPVTFEKVIAGDTVACFDREEKQAFFIRFPELAETERRMYRLL